jgi:glutaredoxin
MNVEKPIEIIILPAPNCRRSKRIMKYLDEKGITYRCVDLDSLEGIELAERFGFRASPGILVNGKSINPFDLLIQPVCKVDETMAQKVFSTRGN